MSLTDAQLREFKAFACTLAETAAEVIRPCFGRPELEVQTKLDATPVTRADRDSESAMREAIEAHYPGHGILGEEFGSVRTDAEFVWVLDPIDGTKAFTSGCPLFGTLIALLHEGAPVLGVINQPILGQLLIGDGREATLNGGRVHVRSGVSIAEATLLLTDRADIGRHQSLAHFAELERRARLVRTWGDCYGYLLLASGFVDIMLDPVMSPWDLMALIPVVRGAGGVITDWRGNDPVHGNSIVAAAPELHPEVLAALSPPASLPPGSST